MKLLINIFIFILILINIYNINSFYSSKDDVIELNGTNNFHNNVINDNGIWLIEFYAPWCGHCQHLTPEWKKAATSLKSIVNVAAVDATKEENKELVARFGVKGYPTIKIFNADDKKNPIDYRGQRTAEDIVKTALSTVKKTVRDRLEGKTKPSSSSPKKKKEKKEKKEKKTKNKSNVITLTSKNFHESINNDELWLVEFYAPWCGHCKALSPEYEKVAASLDGDVNVAKVDATVHTDIASEYNIEGYPTIKLFTPSKKKPIDYMGPRDSQSISTFALDELSKFSNYKIIRQLTSQDIYDKKCKKNDKNRICIISFLPHIIDSGKDGRNEYISLIERVGKKNIGSGLFKFIWSEGGSQFELENSMNINGLGYPSMVAINENKKVFSVLKGAFDSNEINSFLTNISKKSPTKFTNDIPKINTVEKWNGEDAEIIEEEFSLEDIMGDDEL